MSAFTDAITRLASFYNGNGYSPSTNPGGMDNNGHQFNFVPSLQDVATVGQMIAALVTMATAAANQAGAWLQPILNGQLCAVTHVSPTTFTVAGDWSSVFVSRRAVHLVQTTSLFGYTSSATYSDTTGLTTVVMEDGYIVDSGLSEVWCGQDPKNAPQSEHVPSFLFIPTYQTSNGL